MSKNLVFTAEQLEMLKMTAEDLSLYVAISLFKEKKIDLKQAGAISGMEELSFVKKMLDIRLEEEMKIAELKDAQIDQDSVKKKPLKPEDFNWTESRKRLKKYKNLSLSDTVIEERRNDYR